ncbi:MAG: CooT family nickel-binding protein [Desulfobulbaceae bacterium]|jgi:predicted RNA-binding protein|nr:CooT family nickel-binding protein [Desulfobulbaceae bacterium]MDH3783010.1 CooT family nickel-binding protein [Desulfobulbaceae bacterium]MDH3996440.1 CooT family nickel-binding protein [Desulfobulbaceae bacterium]PLX50455.1 MAG: RNA-binding protein [Desulfobulbaceae bacterium]HKJ14957.1 CooT family nickel-binding protein [Desulfobulbales bacterium]
MCQMNVVLKNNGRQENIMENVTNLEVTNEGVLVSAFFEDPKLVKSARVKSIDFLGGTVTLDNEVSDHD